MRRLDPDAKSRPKARKKNAFEEGEEKESAGKKRDEGSLVAEANRSNQDGIHQGPAPDAIGQFRQPGQVVTNSLGIRFAWIPPRTFLMGSPAGEKEREGSEAQHQARLSKGFFMGTCPVTQAHWKKVMGENPSRFRGENLPVEQISWHECAAFCKKMSEMDGKLYRLPSESEWEHACRAGTITPFHFGETILADQGNFDAKYPYGDGKKGTCRQQTTPVDEFAPNAWGLFDVHGNVWEWCSDWYGIYPTEDSVDCHGPTNGAERVIRGGAWNQIPKRCRSAYRECSDPNKRRKDVGFRVCFSED